jgi:orotate phosphoribosyltransferase
VDVARGEPGIAWLKTTTCGSSQPRRFCDDEAMHLVPTQEEVVKLLRRTGGLRDGHFEYSRGQHANEYLQVALTMRYYDAAKILSVGLSRQLRAHSDIRAMIPELSIVAPGLSGLPVAYGVCEALRARQVYWAERDNADEPLEFRQYQGVEPKEKVLIVDDILRSGIRLAELRALVESRGGRSSGRGRNRQPA